MIDIEQTREDADLYCWSLFELRECPMFTSQRKEREDPQIIAIVELDMQKLRLQIVWAREAIRERLRELEHLGDQPHCDRRLIPGD